MKTNFRSLLAAAIVFIGLYILILTAFLSLHCINKPLKCKEALEKETELLGGLK